MEPRGFAEERGFMEPRGFMEERVRWNGTEKPNRRKGEGMKQSKVELLAPAGSYESMRAAVNAGADAVYIGGSRFGARAYAENLEEEAMVRAIDFVHLHGCRIYMTVNTLVKEQELSGLYAYLKPYYEAGLDAVLVQDLGVFSYLRRQFPQLPLHISTQMTVTGSDSAKMLKEMGAVRVVPARELSLEEIRAIAGIEGLEAETFIHGALCYCYSGQCLFSSLIGGRSGNRGRCAQTCRLPFTAERDKKTVGKKGDDYPLSLKDLNTLELLPDILEAGVVSLKIEGRMKSPRYTAGVVSIYRKYVDLYFKKGREGYRIDPEDTRRLLELFDRGGQSGGYYKQHNGRDMVVLKEKPAFRTGDPAYFDFLDRTYGNEDVKIPIKGTGYFSVGKPARLTLEAKLAEGRREGGAFGETLLLQEEGQTVQEAQNAPMEEERIKKQLLKTGDSPFVFEDLSVTTKGRGFLPVQELNRLRRTALEHLEKELVSRYRREPVSELPAAPGRFAVPESPAAPERLMESRTAVAPEISVFVSTKEQLETALSVLGEWKRESQRTFSVSLASESFGPEAWRRTAQACHEKGLLCYLMMPRIFRKTARDYFLKNRQAFLEAGFDAAGIPSMEEPGFFQSYAPEMKLYFDHGMYCWNHLAAETMAQMGADRVTFPVELNQKELMASGVDGELIVYGYLPMMVSAQCIKKTEEGCSKRPELLYLKDRKGKRFPVMNQCRFCYNTIYNCEPLSLLGLSKEAAMLKPVSLRLNFTVEDGTTAARVLRAFGREYLEGQEPGQLPGSYTRGHFKRGVE